jgi:Trk K+ transport system NAD-binding subunit
MNELRAKGSFIKTILGVTLVKDIIVVILFAITTSIAATLLSSESFNLSFFLLVGLELLGSLFLGLLLGRVLAFILSTHIDKRIKITIILVLGYLVFAGSAELRHYSHEHMPFEILFEPLLICMIGSFWLTNQSPYRNEFLHLLHRVEAVIFVIFFTLVGDSLNIAVVITILPLTLALFAARVFSLFIGGVAGGVLSGDPAQYNRLAWMGYITQAGVGLGLAKEVAIEFPELGDDFTAIMVAVIVISQLIGPPFFKYAIKKVGESHIKGQGEPDEIRDVLIVGIENESHALAERLQAHHWQVILADIDPNHVTVGTSTGGVQSHLLNDISRNTLDVFITPATDAVVAMLPDDDLNLRFCELAYEVYGVNRIIVRLNDYASVEEFQSLDAIVVYPSSAMVHLLDNLVRAPQLASYLLHDQPENEVVQITINDSDIHGLHMRDVILPDDVLVVAIKRDGHSIVPHGYTSLHLHDEVTLIGLASSLEEVTIKLGY